MRTITSYFFFLRRFLRCCFYAAALLPLAAAAITPSEMPLPALMLLPLRYFRYAWLLFTLPLSSTLMNIFLHAFAAKRHTPLPLFRRHYQIFTAFAATLTRRFLISTIA